MPSSILHPPSSPGSKFGCGFAALAFAALCCLTAPGRGAIPAPERLLPEDTLAVVTAPDATRLKELCRRAPEFQCWNDDALKPFRDKLLAKAQEGLLQPLERELNLSLADLAGLLRGQVTLALTQNGWQGAPDQSPAWLVLIDTRESAGQLSNHLAALRKHWSDVGRPARAERIGNFEFAVAPLASNDVPKALRPFLPHPLEYHELGADTESKRPTPPSRLVVGQAESLFIAGSSLRVVEQVVLRMQGGAAPALGDQAAFAANYQAFFRTAPLYAWVNAKVLFDVLARQAAGQKENPLAPSPVEELPLDKQIHAFGLGELNSVALSLEDSNDGLLFRAFVGVPETRRRGLLKILAGEAREWRPPPFVPADALTFQRWRLDGQKAWAALEQTLLDLSPRSLDGLNLIFSTVGAKAREKEPGYDLKKALLGNLGDDFITLAKAPHGSTAVDLDSSPSLLLIGSPNPEQLAAAFKALFVILPGADSATEREFLGRKVFSIPLPPSLPLPLLASAKWSAPATLHYAASHDYVALSTDALLVEEYLRSNQSQGRSLRETPGLAEATQKVAGPGTDLFGYENRAELVRASFEALRKAAAAPPTSAEPASWPSLPGLSNPDRSLRQWMDFALLPPFDKLAKYFHFAVYGGSVSVDGLTYQLFLPTPPGLKR